MPEKIIRDPVHDVIAFRMDKPVDQLLFSLIGAAEFQRLRRIRQLGLASLAYPGADHARYSHSLGVMETARKILSQLRQTISINEEQETICVAAALLHDLGHGPFSHVFEQVTGIDHESLTRRIIEDPESDVHRRLAEHDRLLPGKLAEFLASTQPTFLHDVISSQLDADRLDYLLRDNLMTGSRYGDYDLNWLLHALTVDPRSNRLAVTWKGISAVEAYLQARFHMYRNVYFHKVVRSAEGMIRLALQRAKRLAVQDRLQAPTRNDGLYKSLLGQRLSAEEFTDLDDVSVTHCFKLWTRAEDTILAGLCRGLLFRELFKTHDISSLDSDAARAALKAAVQAIESAGGDPAYHLFYDEPSDTPYETYRPDNGNAGKEILVCAADGNVSNFASVSPFTAIMNRQLMFRRIHVAPAYKSAWST
jgi:HD superfamily phosphohydrolase